MAKEQSMIFNPSTRARRTLAALMAAGLIGGTALGAAATSHAATSKTATPAAKVAAPASTVPASVVRAETAAEDVIGFLEKGQPSKSKMEARILGRLAHGGAADALRQSGVSGGKIAAFQRRADRTARLSLRGAADMRVSQAANSVSRLMPAFYSRYHDPVPSAVLKLDYLDRQVQLDAQSGNRARLRQTVGRLEATWQQLRPKLVRAGGAAVARSYDGHVAALKRNASAASVKKEAVHGLDLVDQMESVFLGT
jgi:hypothetical protein